MIRRRAAAGAGGALVLTAAVTAGVLVGSSGGGDAGAAGASTATKIATVSRRDLVETDSEDGTLGYSDARTLVNRMSGTVTDLPSVGSVVRPNHRLYAVDGQAVYLLDGGTPAFRDLGPSTSSGRDVLQLERNLRAGGYDTGHDMRVDGIWDAGTTAAVRRWQAAKGLTQDGTIELGRVVFAPGARRIAKIDVTLGGSALSGSGQAATSGGGAGPAAVVGSIASTLASAVVGTAQAQTPDATTTTTTTDATPPPTATATTPATPAPAPDGGARTKTVTVTVTTPAPAPTRGSGTVRPAAAPRSGASGPSAAAASAAPGRTSGAATATTGRSATSASGTSTVAGASPLMVTTSTHQIVAVKLDATKQAIARRGARVAITLPSGEGTTGRIVRVGRVASAPASSSDTQSGSGSSTLKVTIRLVRRVRALDQAPVTVDFEQSRARQVLAVPVTALLARPGGTFAVERRDGGERRLVPVTTGLSTDGYVEVHGDVRPGDRVTNAGL